MKTNADGTVTMTADEIDSMIARGETRTDWARAAATTDTDLERQALTDPDIMMPPEGWEATARAGFPFPTIENKQQVTVRLDPEVLNFFKREGRGWQTRLNAVLRSYVSAQR